MEVCAARERRGNRPRARQGGLEVGVCTPEINKTMAHNDWWTSNVRLI